MSTIKTTHLQHPSAASPAITLDAAGNLLMPGGKILQIVRATDGTTRSTTSTSYVDTGISVTITPQKTDSAIIILWSANWQISATNSTFIRLQITNASDSPRSGAQAVNAGGDGGTVNMRGLATVIAYDAPATTSATTYKGRFSANSNTVYINNSSTTGQMYAIEVSA